LDFTPSRSSLALPVACAGFTVSIRDMIGLRWFHEVFVSCQHHLLIVPPLKAFVVPNFFGFYKSFT
jgi:hypothetical protein